MGAGRVVLVRHGESEWNAERRWQGHGGTGLTPAGHGQARMTAAFLVAAEPEVGLLAASDLQRVAETAAPIADALGLPVVVDERLREIDVGWWSGMTRAEIADRDPEASAAVRAGEDVPRGGAETDADLRHRVVEVLDELVDRARGTLLVVTHGGVVRAAVAQVLDLSIPQLRRLSGPGNCSRTVLERRDGAWRLRVYGGTGHLGRHD